MQIYVEMDGDLNIYYIPKKKLILLIINKYQRNKWMKKLYIKIYKIFKFKKHT